MKSRIRSTVTLLGMALAAGPCLNATAFAHPDPAAKKVAILIFDKVEVIDYSGPLEVLADAGFDVFTVAESRKPVTTSAGDAVTLTPKYTFADAPQADLVVIPGGGFEAVKDSATVAWVKREAAGAQHTMSVCNGAFTLANTGLLDGLKATTTAGNITRMRRTYSAIQVVNDQRIVDNGKIITTAGLSAGIDGALHMVDVMQGEGAGRSVALAIEYDWRPDAAYVRGKMADRLIPALPDLKIGQPVDENFKGDEKSWETIVWFTTSLAPPELLGSLKTAYEAAYAQGAGPWVPGSVHLAAAGPLATEVELDDRDGRRWKGTISTETVAGEPHEVAIRYAISQVN